MKHPQLKAEARTVLGKQVKKLRREGILPANVYGKALSSTAVQVALTEFNTVFKEVGETGLIDLMVGSEKRPVLVKNFQMNFKTQTPLHVDFYQVNLKEKIKTYVPVELVGEPKAITDKLGMLLTPFDEIEIEALPEAIPDKIEVNIAHLAEVGQQLTVADLKTPEGVTITEDPTTVLAQIGELAQEEPEETPEVEAALPEVIGEKEKAGGEEATEESSEEK
jgi:large subunit ribosomal protein L25